MMSVNMNSLTLFRRIGRIGRIAPRETATWLGAAVVLGCGLWLAEKGGPAGAGLRLNSAATAELIQGVGWVDRRLEVEEKAVGSTDPERECRIASLRWNRALSLAQNEYYRQCGADGSDDREQEYSRFRRKRLAQDPSGDMAAAREAAQRALAVLPPGPARVRPLWIYSMVCAAAGRSEEALGALIEVAHYKPRQAWVWRLLAQAYQLHGDPGREELAEEQAWRAGAGRGVSSYITGVIWRTPYACPAVRPVAAALR
jgi:tetratricopeptide (TPR) repeat protein